MKKDLDLTSVLSSGPPPCLFACTCVCWHVCSAKTILFLGLIVRVCERRPHGTRALSGMPAAAVKPALEDMVAEGGGVSERGVSQWEAPGLGRERLPLPSLKVPRELLRSFPHSKRVGSYLVGKMINKGSFAKVMEGLHIGTGEKVGGSRQASDRREKKITHTYKIMITWLQPVPCN